MNAAGRLNLIVSFVILFLLVVMKIMQTQYSGFVVNLYYPDSMNSLLEIVICRGACPVLVCSELVADDLDGRGREICRNFHLDLLCA